MSNTVFYYVNINTSADSVTGNGTDISAFNYSQFLTQLSKNDETEDQNYFYIKGYRNISATGTEGTENRWIISKGYTQIDSWGSNPWKINCTSDFYFESILDWTRTVKVKNGFIQCAPCSLKFSVSVDYVDFTFDNCWLRCEFNDGLDSRYSGGKLSFINCTLQNFKIQTYNYSEISFINTIIYNDSSNFYYLIQNNPYTTLSFDNVISNRWIYEPLSAINYNVLNPIGTNFVVSSSINSDNIWNLTAVPDVFSQAISSITSNDIFYLSSGFSAIDIEGDTLYPNTWWDGRRDGIGALYFPVLSGFAISANSTTAINIDFKISGTDNFGFLDKVSATYDFDDGSTSAILANQIISHSFDNYGSFSVNATINSYNNWYSSTVISWSVLIGNFNVTIVIYDQFGNNITSGITKPLNNLIFSALVSGDLEVGSYFWDLGDGYSATTNPYYQSYRIEGLKNIRLSAYALEDVTLSVIDTSTVTISATSAEYYVNIMSAYDVCANNTGTSADPFNWLEFKGRVETSGEYLDIYRLSGSRLISATESNRNVLNIDRNKNFTIRDWSVSSYGPWVLEVKDCSNMDKNSILSAAGCTLKNGIIYNKPYSTPSKGGTITIGTTYDMFIVYQGKYSHIIVDPYKNILSGTPITVITSAQSNLIGSTIYLSAENISAWQDTFKLSDYSIDDIALYDLNLTDSVFTNFIRENNNYFSACNAIINNCTFNNSFDQISANFI